jgi:hypothetical protein
MNRPLLLLFAICTTLTGCDRSGDDLKMAGTPTEAASQIEQAFQNANPEVRSAAAMAAEAMRNGEYEKAVVSLTTVKSGPSVTLDQGLAVHSSTVALEARLVSAMASGDENARHAYGLLKAMKAK